MLLKELHSPRLLWGFQFSGLKLSYFHQFRYNTSGRKLMPALHVFFFFSVSPLRFFRSAFSTFSPLKICVLDIIHLKEPEKKRERSMWNSNFLCIELIYWLHGWIDSRFPYVPPFHICNSGCNIKHSGHTKKMPTWIADKIKKESIKTTILAEEKKPNCIESDLQRIARVRTTFLLWMLHQNPMKNYFQINRIFLNFHEFHAHWLTFTRNRLTLLRACVCVFWNPGDYRNGTKSSGMHRLIGKNFVCAQIGFIQSKRQINLMHL